MIETLWCYCENNFFIKYRVGKGKESFTCGQLEMEGCIRITATVTGTHPVFIQYPLVYFNVIFLNIV